MLLFAQILWSGHVVAGDASELRAADSERAVIFSEDFADRSLPAWHGVRLPAIKFTQTRGPDGGAALTMEMHQPLSGNLTVPLPVKRIAGKAILLDVWRKAEKVKTGAKSYYNAKTMVSWKAKNESKARYATTTYSDFSGTFDWERHRYVIKMPNDLQRASVTIGMQECTGKASWSKLTVSVDPRFPSQEALERFIAAEQRQAYAHLDANDIIIKRLDGGIIQIWAAHQFVPRRFWNDAARKKVLATVRRPAPSIAPSTEPQHGDFQAQLSVAFRTRANELEAGMAKLKGQAVNDRIYEIASLRERVLQMRDGTNTVDPARLTIDAHSEASVSPLIFGNNINAQNLNAPYDSARAAFQDGFLDRVRPMGITFLRYPGGCNADVFNWKDTIGPLGQRKEFINYHNGTGRGVARFGVDEFLGFCEAEGMTPLITTAFLKDRPENVDPNDHPNGIRHKYVFAYLKTAPERVQLAADWVEYCNGSTDTPLGKLRAENGHAAPYNVKYWEIGNESYGPDPVGSCTPQEYAKAFPAYVTAMKARDPSIQIVMNGCSRSDWNEPLLRVAGKYADAFQFHIYLTPRVSSYSKLEGRPQSISTGMRLADGIPRLFSDVETLMNKHIGHTLPIIISEFGMGNANNREFMTSVTSPVLVADMWRRLVESPLVLGANKWCLYTGYWFSQIEGPTLRQPHAPYFNRPEQIMHAIYARCRGTTRLTVHNEVSPGAKAVVFNRPDSYGVVLISREAVGWQSVSVELPDAKRGRATCILLTAGHPFLSNENDHDLISKYEFTFEYEPGQTILVPSNSVMGLIVPR